MNIGITVIESKLFKTLLDDADKYISAFEQTLDMLELPIKLNEFQYYIHNVGYWLLQYDKQISELYYSIKFLRNFDYKKFNNNDNPNRIDHLDYTISNYYIRLSSILDKSLQLINAVFNLGISEYGVDRSITTNNFVKSTNVIGKYKKMEKVVSDARQVRNAIIHRSYYTDKNLHKLRIFYSLDIDKEKNADKDLYNYRKSRLTEYINTIEDEFDSKFKEINCIIEKFLHELFLIYLKKKKEFKALGFG